MTAAVSAPPQPALSPYVRDRAVESCPSCTSMQTEVFYELSGIPTNSCLLMATAEDALNCAKGDLRLTYCRSCGFIYNAAFVASLTEYSERYEDTQGFSPFFNRFHLSLAQDLIERFDLRGRNVIEVGCGKGEFLLLLSRLGKNHCIGIDPSAEIGRLKGLAGAERVTLIPEYFSARQRLPQPDFLCCKMTLEHISETAQFVQDIRDALRARESTTVFFQIPSAERILADCAIEDVYYEHCSYFTEASLRRLFELCKFSVKRTSLEYDGQYLTIEATPTDSDSLPAIPLVSHGLHDLVATFAARSRKKIDHWVSVIRNAKAHGKHVVIWGSGSKAVSFLHSLGNAAEVDVVTDINPRRHGHFMPGTGHAIISPDALAEVGPAMVIVMNRVYEAEITEQLESMEIDCEIVCL